MVRAFQQAFVSRRLACGSRLTCSALRGSGTSARGGPTVAKDLLQPKNLPVGEAAVLAAVHAGRPRACVAWGACRMAPMQPCKQPPRAAPHTPYAATTLEWKRPLEIVKYPDPRLRAVNARVAVFDATLLQLAKEMIEVMYQ